MRMAAVALTPEARLARAAREPPGSLSRRRADHVGGGPSRCGPPPSVPSDLSLSTQALLGGRDTARRGRDESRASACARGRLPRVALHGGMAGAAPVIAGGRRSRRLPLARLQ